MQLGLLGVGAAFHPPTLIDHARWPAFRWYILAVGLAKRTYRWR